MQGYTWKNHNENAFAALVCSDIGFGMAGVARTIPIEFTHVWYPTASKPAAMLLLGFGLIGLAWFLSRKSDGSQPTASLVIRYPDNSGVSGAKLMS